MFACAVKVKNNTTYACQSQVLLLEVGVTADAHVFATKHMIAALCRLIHLFLCDKRKIEKNYKYIFLFVFVVKRVKRKKQTANYTSEFEYAPVGFAHLWLHIVVHSIELASCIGAGVVVVGGGGGVLLHAELFLALFFTQRWHRKGRRRRRCGALCRAKTTSLTVASWFILNVFGVDGSFTVCRVCDLNVVIVEVVVLILVVVVVGAVCSASLTFLREGALGGEGCWCCCCLTLTCWHLVAALAGVCLGLGAVAQSDEVGGGGPVAGLLVGVAVASAPAALAARRGRGRGRAAVRGRAGRGRRAVRRWRVTRRLRRWGECELALLAEFGVDGERRRRRFAF